MRLKISIGAAIPLLGVVVLAQSHVTIRDSDAPLGPSPMVPLEEKLALLRLIVWRNPQSPEEASVITSAEVLYKDLFRFKLNERTGAAVTIREDDDLALARFTVDAPQRGVSEVLLWDSLPTLRIFLVSIQNLP